MDGLFRGEGLKARAYRGAALTFLSFGGQNFLRLASNLVLTRLLFPEAFGLMALVGVVLAGANMFSDLGLHSAIVQNERGEDPSFLNTAWTIQIARGVVLWVVILLLANPIAALYGEPLLAELLFVSAIIPFINGFNSTNFHLANRGIQLGRITLLLLGSTLANILSMILLAWWLESVWALAIGPIVAVVVKVILSHTIMPGPRNGLHFDRAAARRLFSFGKYIFLSTLAFFFVRQGDTAILGKFIDLDELAYYRIGFFLAIVPVTLAEALSEKVIFPLYARRPPADSPDYRRKINKSRVLLTGGLMALALFTALVGDWLIELLYDARYAPAGPLLVLIAVFSLPTLILVSYPKLPLAAGHSGRFASFTILNAAVQTALLFGLVPIYGAAGAAVAPGLAMIISYPMLIWIIHPFKGWDPVHDLVFATFMTTSGGLILWQKWPILAPLFGAA